MKFQGLLADIAEATSPETAMLLVQSFGGTRIRFPHPKTVEKASDDHWLIALVGREPALAIADQFMGSWVCIPTGYRLLGHERRERIRNMIAEGSTANVIARSAGCSVRTVYRHRNIARRAARSTSDAPIKGQEP